MRTASPYIKRNCFKNARLVIFSLAILLSQGKVYAQTQPNDIWFTELTRFDNHAVQSDADGEGYVERGTSHECQRNYFFTSYVDSQIKFSFIPAFAYLATNQLYMRYTIYHNSSFVRSFGIPTTIRRSGDYFVTNPQYYTPPAPGTYNILFEVYDDVLGQWVPGQDAYFTVIPKIEKVWIEADPICAPLASDPTDNKIHFKIKTYPDIASVMHYEPLYQTGVSVGTGTSLYCKRDERLKIGISCNVEGLAVHSNYESVNLPYYGGTNNVNGSLWGSYNTSLQDDFWVNYHEASSSTELADYINGSLKGYPVRINLIITDSVSLNKTFAAPLLINYPTGTATHGSGYHSLSYKVPATITTETWTPQNNPAQKMYGTDQSVYKIKDSLVIPAGKTLIIRNMQIELGPLAQVYLQTAPGSGKTGGYLKLDSSTLTAARDCSDNYDYWGTINVSGDASQPQGTPPCAQGVLEMVNQSRLSYSRWAAVARDGGQISAGNSYFYNNIRSVAFGAYKWVASGSTSPQPYLSSFYNCEFSVDNQLPTPFIGHLLGVGVRGITVNGCRFKNNGATPATGYNWGIYGTDFGVTVDRKLSYPSYIPSEFYGLDKGVYIGTTGSIATGVTVRRAQFTGNQVGVQTDGGIAPYIRYNSFSVPSYAPASPYSGNGIGVFVNTGSGYTVSDNAFSAGNNLRTNGVLVSNTGSGNNSVHSNTYNNLSTGNLSNFINRSAAGATTPSGLQFLCNGHSGNRWDIAARGRNASIHGMAASQGASSLPAGNTFASTVAYNIYNPNAEVGGVTYYYKSGVSNQTPALTFGNVTPFGTSFPNPCTYPAEPDISGGGGSTTGSGYGGVVGKVAYFLNDPDGIPHRDSLHIALADWVSPYSDLLKTDLLLEEGNTSAANTTYNAIATTYGLDGTEATEFSYWGRRLMDLRIALNADSKTTVNLDAAQVQNLEGIADSARMWARVRAQSWLSLYDERQFTTETLFPEDAIGGGLRLAHQAAEPYYQIAPNPAKEQIQISFVKDSDVDQVFSLMDITGRIVLYTKLSGLSGSIYLDIHHLQPGMYLYRISENGLTKSSGKLGKE